MIGRVRDRRAAMRNPARVNADGTPVHRNGSGVLAMVGEVGYPSTVLAPRRAAMWAAAAMSRAEIPRRRWGFCTKRQEIDHTGRSSTGARIRDRSR
jgi:hypothetical protein